MTSLQGNLVIWRISPDLGRSKTEDIGSEVLELSVIIIRCAAL